MRALLTISSLIDAKSLTAALGVPSSAISRTTRSDHRFLVRGFSRPLLTASIMWFLRLKGCWAFDPGGSADLHAAPALAEGLLFKTPGDFAFGCSIRMIPGQVQGLEFTKGAD